MAALPACFSIGPRAVGAGQRCYLIAEAGVNHNGSLEMAHRLVDVAAAAGADAVKFQTFRAEALVSPAAPKAAYQAAATGAEQSQLDMLRALELGAEDFAALERHCRARAITFLSTPFDDDSADLLDRLGMAAIKVPSGEITNLPFLRRLAGRGRPLIVSTGMADMAEVAAAVACVQGAGAPALALLQCVSSYPAEPAEINLRAMASLASAFAVPAGYSDHTLGLAVPLAAVALGACLVEKHFTLDPSLPGPDHRASLTPAELTALVAGVRAVEASLGDGVKVPSAAERANIAVGRKSLVAARDLAAGTVLTAPMLTARRPGTGISPAREDEVVGRRLAQPVAAGALLQWDMLA